MVLLLPPAPAARVLAGRALATLSARSAAAFLRIAVAGPPGAFGEAARAVVVPVVGDAAPDDYETLSAVFLMICSEERGEKQLSRVIEALME